MMTMDVEFIVYALRFSTSVEVQVRLPVTRYGSVTSGLSGFLHLKGRPLKRKLEAMTKISQRM
ncbi:BnaC07g06980D [Brassica napus]|uniref:Uncharacterized protein n=2 Tax=Brassica TaxID=3705 RepID=A0A3P6ECH7_BRAOL|nr:unnamed protein product [Brassica napus]CDY47805.1 BnaC07g06980D [Brassica napus]VDD35346.1 unnamed protein product [Brassica oleracea]